MSKRQRGQSQATATAQAAISERTGCRIENGQRLSTHGERRWRTREDPFETIWEKKLVPLLESEPQLTGLTLWEFLEDEHAGQFFHCLTLQRRIKQWKAAQGLDKVVIFHQSVSAGQGNCRRTQALMAAIEVGLMGYRLDTSADDSGDWWRLQFLSAVRLFHVVPTQADYSSIKRMSSHYLGQVSLGFIKPRGIIRKTEFSRRHDWFQHELEDRCAVFISSPMVERQPILMSQLKSYCQPRNISID